MKKLFVIGGMGAGKSTVAHALEALGLPAIDLDDLAGEVLRQPAVRQALAEAFGPDVVTPWETVDRKRLAARAFATPEATAALNEITQPRIAAAFADRIVALEATGATAVVVEYPLFPQQRCVYVDDGDLLIAVVAPLELRVRRAVASGFSEADVRRRIAAQADDGERIEAADVTFVNDGTAAELVEMVETWWRSQVDFVKPTPT